MKKKKLASIINKMLVYQNSADSDVRYCITESSLLKLASILELNEIDFSPTNRIEEGRKFESKGSRYDDGAIFLKWHSPDSVAPLISNSKIMWTAQIRYNEKVGSTYRFIYIYVEQSTGKVSFSRFPNRFGSHIPVIK